MSEKQNLIAIEGIKAQQKLELDNLKAAIENWKQEEILWKEREAELLKDSERLDKIFNECLIASEYYLEDGNTYELYGIISDREGIDKLGGKKPCPIYGSRSCRIELRKLEEQS